MVPAELLKKVRRIQIRTAAIVNDVFAGHYHSAFKGRGIEFDEVREYQPGDDVRLIDWNVTARAGKPYIKSFREERELTVVLAVDVSGSQDFGAVEQFKRDLAAEIGATLALSAVQNNDKVGLLLFSDRVELAVPPRKGKRHVLRLVRELLHFSAASTGTNVGVALEQLSHVLKRRAIIFLISDFHSPEFHQPLRVLRRRHDVVPVLVRDQREAELPSVGLVEFYDPETGRQHLVNTSSRRFRDRYAQRAAQRREALRAQFRRQRLELVEVETGGDLVAPLLQFFRQREHRR